MKFLRSTNWYFPTSGNAQIKQVGTSLCMTIDANLNDAIILETCNKNGIASQEWIPESAPGGLTAYTSLYQLLCLNDNVSTSQLDAIPCNYTNNSNQRFGPST